VRKTLEKREAYETNLSKANANLSEVDFTLGDVSDLLLQAQQLASANVGDSVTADERAGAAAVVKSIASQLFALGNKSFEGSYLFAGDRLDQAPFVENDGGMQFVGSRTKLQNDYDESTTEDFQVDGNKVWGALSTRIEGNSGAAPSAGSLTRLGDLNGTTGHGIRPGSIQISNGTGSVVVNLNNADTLGDVASEINAANFGAITAAISADGTGLTISGGAAEAISITDISGGHTAADLGIRQEVAGPAGDPIVGEAVKPRITGLTPLSSLNSGAGIDTSGLILTNGAKSATIDLSSAQTVQDMLNAINGSETGVRAEINDDGTGIRLLNSTQGNAMRVAENGGSSAADLGLRSFTPSAELGALNAGKGVRTVDGVDLRVTDSNGVAFDVDLTAAVKTVDDVIGVINDAATAAGANVTAAFATTGNGITLTDAAGGGTTLAITAQNFSNALTDLGLDQPVVGGVITGRDVHQVEAQGVFANIRYLEAALASGNQGDITKAAERLQADYDRVVRTRGEVGAQVKGIEARSDRLVDQNLATKALLSDLEDTDFNEAISKFSLLQTSLQASMQVTGKTLDMSLMDFIR
ncbi:MAG TPA: flagellin, partial [Tepidisphaeraceae bacterium]